MFQNQKFVVGSIGYFSSPAGHQSDQKFHVDYNNRAVRQIFIPLVDLTSRNSTQFLRIIPPSEAPEKLRMDDAELLGHLQKQGIDFYESSQIVAAAYSILDMGEMVFHRGVANRT